MKNKNLIFNFSNIYDQEKNKYGAIWLDCSGIKESDMYCSKRAANAIKSKIAPFGTAGVHFLDSGNFHYVTKFFVDEIREPFVLVVFDHHNDMQKSKIPEMLTCGSWVAEVCGKQSANEPNFEYAQDNVINCRTDEELMRVFQKVLG